MTIFQKLGLLLLAIFTTACLHSFQNQTQHMIVYNNADYEKEWAEINQLEQQGLPKSALEKVLALYEKAKTEENPAQVIKCLIYRGKYESQLEEDGLVHAIHKWHKEIEIAEFPIKPMLQSMLAEMYSSYLNNNRYRFQNRTQTTEWKAEDIRTWTIEQLIEESGKLYEASLNYEGLKQVKLEGFDAILQSGHNEKGLRPTLFDFLAHRAIDYFMNEQAHLTQPTYQFYIDDAQYLQPAKEFVKIEINTPDTTNFKYKTLLLFQDLLSYRLANDNVPALIDVELKRLKFVHDNAVLDTKYNDYVRTLRWASKNYYQNDAASEIFYAWARAVYTKGANYQPTPDETDRWLWKQALEICDNTINRYPKAFGSQQCQALKSQILQKSLNLQTEEVNLPNQPFLTLLTYRNVPKVHLKVIRMNEKRLEEFESKQRERNSNEKLIAYFNSLPAVQKTSYDLPDEGDYRGHSVEIKIDELPFGQYVILTSDNETFTMNGGTFGYLFTNVSNLGFWHRRDAQYRNEFVVFNRTSGQPLENVDTEFWTRDYNSVFRKYEYKKAGEGRTAQGGFVMPKLNKNQNFRLLLKNGNDTLFLNDNFYQNEYRDNRRSNQQMHFFLDRAIYRPGQTVYFKGILIENDKERVPSILNNQKVIVTFRDANYQEVEKLELTTNEYGTVNGTFIAPKGGLLGQMHLSANTNPSQSQKYFSVEEYKRPKFEVGFDPVKEGYKLDDEVIVQGFAKAYAGNNIDGAKVTYRVVREVRFPWVPWWYWRGGYNPWSSQSQEIANGTTTTDSAGKFEIRFPALPDRNVPKDKKPEFTYTVYADVIDITGETHSNQNSVKVGYIALNVDVPIAEKVNVDSLKKLSISTKNLNGEFEPATGSLTLELLQAPDRIFVNRLWQKPDNHILTKLDFARKFPHFAHENEDEAQNWKVKRQAFAIDFDTENSTEIDLAFTTLVAGTYKLTLKTQDKYGAKVELEKIVQLYDLNAKKPAVPTLGFVHQERTTFEPEELAKMYFATSVKELPVLLELERDQKILERKWLKVKDLQTEVHQVQEQDRGNVFYHVSYAQFNRSNTSYLPINVPWSNKELSIEYGTFRDKLLPGQEEEWLIKIKGPKGEKVAAEMVAGMYDASLDAFAVNNWGMNLFPMNWVQRSLSARGFGHQQGRFLTQNWQPSFGGDHRNYQHLNWFDFSFYQHHRMKSMRGGRVAQNEMMMRSAPAAAAPEMMEEASFAFSDSDADGVAQGNIQDQSAKKESLVSNSAEKENNLNENDSNLSDIPVRTNLNETVFFFPNLMTDKEGNVLIKFTMNEALTKWKFLGVAHTKNLQSASTMKEVVTQKDLMVMPNPPRFFREGDEIEYTAKVVNLSEGKLSGTAVLNLNNGLTGKPVFGENSLITKSFEVEAGQSTPLSWRFKVPNASEVPMIEHTVLAQAGDYSDAERSAAPVLSNRMLVTETKPLPVRGKESKVFTFESMKNNDSKTLTNHAYTLEFTSNPAWYAVQALPYLMEYPYDCTEQIFSRYYANTLATSVANSHPKVKAVFERWRDYEPEALLSNLSKNQELKTALLAETPWVLNAQSEEQQKKNIALLFDLNRMSYEQEIALAKLTERQLANGGWAWFPGGRDSWYITQYLVEGLGHLDKLGVQDVTKNEITWRMVKDAVRYCDARIVEQYEQLEEAVKAGRTTWEADHLDNMAIHYLYARTFFLEDKSTRASTRNDRDDRGKRYLNLEGKAQKVFDYYLGQSEKYWLKKGMYQEGMIALALHRMAKGETTTKMIKSFKERALNHEELGMYWKFPSGYWWYQLPIETQSLMVEVFDEVANDAEAVNNLKLWLLKNKQTNHWKTTKATAAAVYALLMNGDNWLLSEGKVSISFPTSSNLKWEQQIKEAQKTAEAGTGYFKTKIEGKDVLKSMATVQVQNPNNHPAWGAVYWQYFEDLDKITTFEETPLTLKKQLFKVENSPTGEVIVPISQRDLQPGDKLKVRIELRVDRAMEYVHMKDMRASGFEPINVLSQYKWQAGLGYYESTRDASTNFFFSYLPKGTHVFEYPLRVIHKGDFSNGITTVQCMYAPEFTSHSEGVRVEVK